MTTTTRSASGPDGSRLGASARRRSGVVLLVGALLVSFAVVPLGTAKLYWVPVILGLSYLLAGVVGGRRSPYWAAGLIVSTWGVAVLLVLRKTLTTDFSGTAITAIGVGLVLAAMLPRLGVAVSPASLALPVLLLGGLELLQAESLDVFSKGWLFGVLVGLRGLYDLRPGA